MLQNKETTIDININKNKLIRSEILTLYVWQKNSTNKIKATKRELQLKAKKFKTNFNRDCENLNKKIKQKINYDPKQKKISCNLHLKGNKNFVKIPSWIFEIELNQKSDKSKNIINQCIIDTLFLYKRISFNQKSVKFYGIEQVKKMLNKILQKICGKNSRQYTYEEIRLANKYLKLHKLIEVEKNEKYQIGFLKPIVIKFFPSKINKIEFEEIKSKTSWNKILKKLGPDF